MNVQARPLLKKAMEDGIYDALVDPKLQKDYGSNEMARMISCAAACVRHLARLRPRMGQVIPQVQIFYFCFCLGLFDLFILS